MKKRRMGVGGRQLVNKREGSVVEDASAVALYAVESFLREDGEELFVAKRDVLTVEWLLIVEARCFGKSFLAHDV